MNSLSEESPPSLAESLDYEIAMMLRFVTLEEVAKMWPEYHFVPFCSVPINSEFKIAGIDRSKGMITGLKKVTNTVSQKLHRSPNGTVSCKSVSTNAKHTESGTEDMRITHHRICDETPVIVV